MVINNLTDKVYILFEGDEGLVGNTYTVSQLQGNLEVSGDIIDDQISLQLPDGVYRLTVYNETEEDFVECFNVYYNGLPTIIQSIRLLLCPCNNCRKTTSADTLKVLYETLGFYQSAGLLCDSYTFSKGLNLDYQRLLEKKQWETYYGDSKYDYSRSVEKLLVSAYVELYVRSTQQLNLSEEELNKINSTYKIDIMERCLFHKEVDLQELICDIQKHMCHV